MITTTLLMAAAIQYAPLPPAPASPYAAPAPAAALAVGYAPRAAYAPVPAAPRTVAPEAWLPQDPADSLYRAGRRALNGADYREAARIFARIRDRHPRSGYVADSYYWEAFARSRTGSPDDLRESIRLIEVQQERHADARTSGDARALANRIRGELARRGDVEAARRLAEEATAIAPPPPPPSAGTREARPARPPRAPRPPRPGRDRDHDCDEDNDERMIALSALMNMRAEQAIPILRQVLERREPGTECLRRQAMFLVAQKRGADVENIMISAVQSDPDQEVREAGIFWLSQVNTDRAAAILDSVLQNSSDPELQGKAIFALSQQRGARGTAALRSYALREDVDPELRENAIFWLGQRKDPESVEFLRELYGRTSSQGIKEKIIFAMSQQNSAENADWLLSVAQNESENLEIRANALFWAGQMRAVNVERLGALYDELTNREMKDKLIFALSQRREPAAVDKLMDIARNETDQELRRQALFWLGQSRDPRVAEFLLEIINR